MAASKKKTSKKTSKKATKKAPSFEDGLKVIEARIAELESGELSLEASIEAYEAAMGSLKSCYAMLNQAEGKIAMLTKAAQDSTIGGEYDVESGSATEDEEELAVAPDADVIEVSAEEDFDDEDDDQGDNDSSGTLPF